MYRNKTILALIPARLGSKGLPGKNIKLLSGKPLIAWAIQQALKSKYIDKIAVTTDSRKIAGLAEKYGAEAPFIRPKKLATALAKGIDVLLHAVRHFEDNGDNFDIILWLQPTSPLRACEDIDNSIELLFKKNALSVISVCRAEHHPWLSLSLNTNGAIITENTKRFLNKNRQDMPDYYRINGAVYLSYAGYLKKTKSFLGKKTYAYVMPVERSVDIDTVFDFKLAQFLIKERAR